MRYVLIVLAFMLCSAPAQAAETQPLNLNGADGVWMPKDKAAKILQDLDVLKATQDALSAQRELNRALEDKTRLALETKAIWKDVALAPSPWWKNPGIVGLFGFTVGGLVVAGISMAIFAGAH